MVADEAESPEEYLRGHNTARVSVGVPPLKWDVKLEKIAQKLMNEYLTICQGIFVPSKPSMYGKNLAWHVKPEHYTAAKAIAEWVEQKKYYDHKSNSCIGGKCECYTQVVWRETTHVGCAKLKCPKRLCMFLIGGLSLAGDSYSRDDGIIATGNSTVRNYISNNLFSDLYIIMPFPNA
ncbi:pathogenesis-related protein PRB1-3-like [Arachis ipaensis]|nr:pathogenesis-related protein PRB1-3-like [Arachis ipaensis]